MKVQNVERLETSGKLKCAMFKACATFKAKTGTQHAEPESMGPENQDHAAPILGTLRTTFRMQTVTWPWLHKNIPR